jgi:hypothetical protein
MTKRRKAGQSKTNYRTEGPSQRKAGSQKGPREKEYAHGIDKVSVTIAIVGALVAGVAAVFAGLAYFSQADATRAANTAVLQQYASKVSYTLEVSAGKPRELVITNRSIGAISNLAISFPQPVQGCSAPCDLRGSEFIDLMNIPACGVLTTSLLNAFSHPSVGAKSLAGSDLVFTDQNGHTWALFGGEHNRLVELTGYKAPAGVVTLPASGLTQANGCS